MCYGIFFSVINNPFFRELLYQLCPNYTPSSHKVLSGTMLNDEVAKVTNKVTKELKNADNLTLGK